jgi:acetyl-CoA C-acetyltransferase
VVELATLTERNRLVAEPYGRLVVARDQVNQGGAVVLASVGEARRLGVPEDCWVHIHGVADLRRALDADARIDGAQPGGGCGDLNRARHRRDRLGKRDRHDRFYSCFAIPVFNLLDAFGLERDDPRGWTLTGGLPFFGGAGNNYSAHGIAEAVQRCRAHPGSRALVGANGGIMSKYAAGVYSTAPAEMGPKAAGRACPRSNR